MAVVEVAFEALGGVWLDEKTVVPLLPESTRQKLANSLTALEGEDAQSNP